MYNIPFNMKGSTHSAKVIDWLIFVGQGGQWLDVASQFPEQVLNPGHSGESAES